MWRPKIRTFLSIQAVVLVVGALLVSASGAAPAGSATFTDPSGDAQGGPDVTRVAVSGDAATGVLALTVTASGYSAAVAGEAERDIVVWIDIDRNDATGDPEDGTEYGLQAWSDATGKWWNILRWNGAAWESVPESATMRTTGQGDSVTWGLSTADIGGASSFRFYVVAGNWNTASERFDTRDDAPDQGWFSYDIAAATPAPAPSETKVSIIASSPTATPSAPRAGRSFAVAFPVKFQTQRTVTVIDIQTGETRTSQVVSWTPASGGTMTCVASVGRKVPVRCGSFKGDVARMTLVVPKDARGKLLKIAAKITAREKETGKTVSVTRAVSFRVR